MDFPTFILDDIGTRLYIGLTAGIHVLINHPLAVGIYPLITLLEYLAHRWKLKNLDDLARKITFIVFVITTTVGALTGVGIWLATSLSAPFAIGSLLRVFFWGWFVEWLVFISEVILILFYFLTWEKWQEGAKKLRHIRLGVALSVMSWFTMAIIVGILGFMMNSGFWTEQRTFASAFFNPLYVPQLLFRTTYAMMAAGFFALACAYFYTKQGTKLRALVVTVCCGWSWNWALLCIPAGLIYLAAVPEMMSHNIDVGLMSMKYARWAGKFRFLIGFTSLSFLGFGLWGILRSRKFPSWAMILPVFLSIWLLGHFERVREFIRKPYVIADYMYSNGVRTDELAMLQHDGILKHATYSQNAAITNENILDAGKDVFILSCTRCHTTNGVNGVLGKFENMYGADKEWDSQAMAGFIRSMHLTRPYMPPFPGNEREAEALVAYIQALRENPQPLPGAQHSGVEVNQRYSFEPLTAR